MTSLVLGMVTARRGRSLFDGQTLPQAMQTIPAVPERAPAEVAEPNIPIEAEEAATQAEENTSQTSY